MILSADGENYKLQFTVHSTLHSLHNYLSSQQEKGCAGSCAVRFTPWSRRQGHFHNFTIFPYLFAILTFHSAYFFVVTECHCGETSLEDWCPGMSGATHVYDKLKHLKSKETMWKSVQHGRVFPLELFIWVPMVIFLPAATFRISVTDYQLSRLCSCNPSSKVEFVFHCIFSLRRILSLPHIFPSLQVP